jgi:hypothetical protein
MWLARGEPADLECANTKSKLRTNADEQEWEQLFVCIRGFHLSEFAVPWRCEFPFDTVGE